MSINTRKNRLVFRPSVLESGAALEERVVLTASILVTPPPAPPPTQGFVRFGVQQLRIGAVQQFRNATTDLRNAIHAQTNLLFANGQPTQQQVDNFNAYVGGLINATSFRLSSQSALLPNSQRIVENLQNSLLSGNSTSLVSRLATLTGNDRAMQSSRALNNMLNAQLNRTMTTNLAQLGNYFNTTSINRLSVNQSGNRIPLQEFLGGRVISQLGNTLGALRNSFSTMATSVLSAPTGTLTGTMPFTPTAEALNTFGSQYLQSLGVTAAQLGSSLNVFNGATSTLSSQIQNSLYGPGTTAGSSSGAAGSGSGLFYLFQQIKGLDPLNPDFKTAVQQQFGTTFDGLVGPLTDFFGVRNTGSQPASLPTSQFSLPFAGQRFFNSTSGTTGTNVGFNNGFGSGFMGFGQAPTTFNTNFASGFNTALGSAIYGYGIRAPNFDLSNGRNGVAIN